MKFDHEYIENNEILNKYLLHQLNKEETDKFEEHLLFCSECREHIENASKVFDNLYSELIDFDVAQIDEDSGISGKKKYLNIKLLYKIAASVIVLISVGASLHLLFNNDRIEINNQVSETLAIDTLKVDESDTIESYFNKPVSSPVIASLEYDSTLFMESLFFEKIINDTERGSKIQIELPKIGQEFKNNSKITFKWEGISDEIFLTIFDNKGQLIFEQKAKSPYIFPEKLEQGLYYWQLENEDYSLYTGKFIVK